MAVLPDRPFVHVALTIGFFKVGCSPWIAEDLDGVPSSRSVASVDPPLLDYVPP